MTGPGVDYLAHYSSQYYDPAKAHEYYLKNRELAAQRAGRTKEQKVTDANQSQALAFAKRNISVARKAESDKAVTDQRAKLEALQQKAKATADEIASKLQSFADQISKVDTPIPKDANPKLKAYLLKNQKARTGRAKAAAAAQLKQTALDLRDAVKKARDDYAAARLAMDKKYKQAVITEQTNIQQNIK